MSKNSENVFITTLLFPDPILFVIPPVNGDAVENFPPILGGAEAREGIEGGKCCARTEAESWLPQSTTPLNAVNRYQRVTLQFPS